MIGTGAVDTIVQVPTPAATIALLKIKHIRSYSKMLTMIRTFVFEYRCFKPSMMTVINLNIAVTITLLCGETLIADNSSKQKNNTMVHNKPCTVPLNPKF